MLVGKALISSIHERSASIASHPDSALDGKIGHIGGEHRRGLDHGGSVLPFALDVEVTDDRFLIGGIDCLLNILAFGGASQRRPATSRFCCRAVPSG